MEMMKMKNKIVLLLGGILLTMASFSQAHARRCVRTPDPIVLQKSSAGEYVAVWDTFDRNPRIYYSDIAQYYNSPNVQFFDVGYVIAEFDSESNIWLFYGWVGDNLIKRTHRHWRKHRRSYRRCLGYAGHYHYKPYYPHYTYDWFSSSLQYHHRLYRKRYYGDGTKRRLHRYYKPRHGYRSHNHTRRPRHYQPRRKYRRPQATQPHKQRRKPHHKKRNKKQKRRNQRR